MLLWFWYCKWRILADNSFATGCKRYEINSVNKVYGHIDNRHRTWIGNTVWRQYKTIVPSASLVFYLSFLCKTVNFTIWIQLEYFNCKV